MVVPTAGRCTKIQKGLGWGVLAKIFSAGILVNSMVAATLQSHTVGRAFLSTYSINPYVVTALMAFVTAIVVIGGIRRFVRCWTRISCTLTWSTYPTISVRASHHAGTCRTKYSWSWLNSETLRSS